MFCDCCRQLQNWTQSANVGLTPSTGECRSYQQESSRCLGLVLMIISFPSLSRLAISSTTFSPLPSIFKNCNIVLYLLSFFRVRSEHKNDLLASIIKKVNKLIFKIFSFIFGHVFDTRFLSTFAAPYHQLCLDLVVPSLFINVLFPVLFLSLSLFFLSCTVFEAKESMKPLLINCIIDPLHVMCKKK